VDGRLPRESADGLPSTNKYQDIAWTLNVWESSGGDGKSEEINDFLSFFNRHCFPPPTAGPGNFAALLLRTFLEYPSRSDCTEQKTSKK
jgi:hypothetical protein